MQFCNLKLIENVTYEFDKDELILTSGIDFKMNWIGHREIVLVYNIGDRELGSFRRYRTNISGIFYPVSSGVSLDMIGTSEIGFGLVEQIVGQPLR